MVLSGSVVSDLLLTPHLYSVATSQRDGQSQEYYMFAEYEHRGGLWAELSIFFIPDDTPGLFQVVHRPPVHAKHDSSPFWPPLWPRKLVSKVRNGV